MIEACLIKNFENGQTFIRIEDGDRGRRLMKPSKETLLNSYIDVKSWSDEDVRKAAEWLAEYIGGRIGSLGVECDYCILFIDKHIVRITAKSFLPRYKRNRITDVSFIFNTE